jgi:hypothetical protein
VSLAKSNRSESRNIIDENEAKGLDSRITTITIFLSLIFLCRAFIDELYAWDLFQAKFENPDVDVVLILITEIAPSFLISWLIRKRERTDQTMG